MKLSKTHIILMVIAVLLVLVLLFSTKRKLEPGTIDSDLERAINEYHLLTDYQQKATVWRELLKTCPYWQAYVSEKFNSGQYDKDIKAGLSLDSLTTRLAMELVERNENILEAYSLCFETPYPTEFR